MEAGETETEVEVMDVEVEGDKEKEDVTKNETKDSETALTREEGQLVAAAGHVHGHTLILDLVSQVNNGFTTFANA